MKKIIICFTFSSAVSWSANAQQQRDTIEFDFHEETIGFKSPKALATKFFNAALRKQDLNKYFGPLDVFLYMIARSGIKDKEKAYQGVYYNFNKFTEERNIYCKALLDNFDSNKMDSTNTKIDTVIYTVDTIPGQKGKFKSADIKIRFISNNTKYFIQLDDCGQIKGKWFIMTPYILWMGKDIDRIKYKDESNKKINLDTLRKKIY